jgi:hypothetical protein
MTGPCMCGALDCSACRGAGAIDWGGNGDEMTEEEIEEMEERRRSALEDAYERRHTNWGDLP